LVDCFDDIGCLFWWYKTIHQYHQNKPPISSKQSTNIIKTSHQYHQNNPPISSRQATNIIKTIHQYHQNNPPISSKQSTNIIKTSNHLSPQIIEHTKVQHMAFEMQVLAWDRYKTVVGWNRLMIITVTIYSLKCFMFQESNI
jgi:uncharacterized protein YneF (UPF0154 family)